jgi:hypothetical protein
MHTANVSFSGFSGGWIKFKIPGGTADASATLSPQIEALRLTRSSSAAARAVRRRRWKVYVALVGPFGVGHCGAAAGADRRGPWRGGGRHGRDRGGRGAVRARADAAGARADAADHWTDRAPASSSGAIAARSSPAPRATSDRATISAIRPVRELSSTAPSSGLECGAGVSVRGASAGDLGVGAVSCSTIRRCVSASSSSWPSPVVEAWPAPAIFTPHDLRNRRALSSAVGSLP